MDKIEEIRKKAHSNWEEFKEGLNKNESNERDIKLLKYLENSVSNYAKLDPDVTCDALCLLSDEETKIKLMDKFLQDPDKKGIVIASLKNIDIKQDYIRKYMKEIMIFEGKDKERKLAFISPILESLPDEELNRWYGKGIDDYINGIKRKKRKFRK